MGETTAKYLAEHFRSLEAVMRATREELTQADEVGGKIADAILDYFADERNLRIIERLRAAGVQFESAERQRASDSLAGKSIVISGKFTAHSRDELKELIELHGGRNLAAVSGNADYLLAGENMGPAKLKKAEKLGIRILSEEEFMEMIGEDTAGRQPVRDELPTPDGDTPGTASAAAEQTQEHDNGTPDTASAAAEQTQGRDGGATQGSLF